MRLVIALTQKHYSLLMRGMGVFAAVLVVMLFIGTGVDYAVAQSVYAPGTPLVVFVSTLGLFPMAYTACFLFGVLAQRSLASQKPQYLRMAGAILCMVLAAVFGALDTKAVLSVRDGFGGIVGAELPTTVRMLIGCGVGCALCVLGYNAGKTNDATDLERNVRIVVLALLISFVLIEIVKNFMSRPRPYTLLSGYEGIEFSPWFHRTTGVGDLMAAYGLERDAFKSFPSGHSLQAAATLTSLYGLSLVYPSLRDKLGIALVVEIVFALTVMSCRMILGAHFLSDVSVGAFMSVVTFLIVFWLVEGQARQS